MSVNTTSEPGQQPRAQLNQHFRFRTGSVMGHAHKNLSVNNQDARILGGVSVGGKNYTIGMVSDGCTAKEAGKRAHNEVGANLMCEFVASEVAVLLSAGTAITDVPAMLFPRCIGCIRNFTGITRTGPPEVITDLVLRMFLCTTVGFILNDEKLVIFNDADGVIIVNDEVIAIDQKNRPSYLGFHLVDEPTIRKYGIQRPQGFTVRTYDAAAVTRFAIATDGITRKAEMGGELIVDPADVEAIWAHQPQAPAGLQWWLNIQSNTHHRLADDATVIAAERLPTA